MKCGQIKKNGETFWCHHCKECKRFVEEYNKFGKLMARLGELYIPKYKKKDKLTLNSVLSESAGPEIMKKYLKKIGLTKNDIVKIFNKLTSFEEDE